MFFFKRNKKKQQSNNYALADKFYSQAKYEKALKEYLKQAEIEHNNTLLNKIGDTCSKMNDTSSALKYFNRVASSYESKGFIDKSIAIYKKIRKLDPDNTEIHEKLLRLYLQKNHSLDMEEELREIANYYIENNLVTRALDTTKNLLELDPSNVLYHNMLAEILIKEGREEDACQLFCETAVTLLEKNMRPQAQMAISEALLINPSHERSLMLSARLNLEDGKNQTGMYQLKTILRNNPSHQEALNAASDACIQYLNEPSTTDFFTELLEKKEPPVTLIETVIKMNVAIGNLDQAIIYLKPLTEKLICREEYNRAVGMVECILNTEKTFEPAILLMADTYTAIERIPEATLVLEKAVLHFLNIDNISKAAYFIQKILTIEPDHSYWRSYQLPSAGIDTVNDTENAGSDIQASLKEPLECPDDSDAMDEETVDIHSEEMNKEYDEDLSTSMDNLLTEAEILIENNLTDHALANLTAILEKYPNHMGANTQIIQVYLDLDEPEKAATSHLALAKALMDLEQFDAAMNHLEKAEPFLATQVWELMNTIVEFEESKRLSGLVDTLSGESFSGFSIRHPTGSEEFLVLSPPEEEVVVFRNTSSKLKDFDPLKKDASISDAQDWSLDIPEVKDPE